MRFLAFSLVIIIGPVFAADAPAIRNFDQVNDHIYRGGQPYRGDYASLAAFGIKTVIDLVNGGEHHEMEGEQVRAAGMTYVHFPLPALSAPKDQDIRRILEVLDTPGNWPVFIHCHRGKDRTGTVIACYRIAHDHWDNEQALREAYEFGLSRFDHRWPTTSCCFLPLKPIPSRWLPRGTDSPAHSVSGTQRARQTSPA